MKGVIIILMKGYNSKSRLLLNKKYHKKLIDALATDLFNTVLEANYSDNLWDCFIATPDKLFSNNCKKKNIQTLLLKPGELNSIFYRIQNWTADKGYDSFILCAGDIPLLNEPLIDKIKIKLDIGLKKRGKSMIVCPSKSNGVSIIAMSPPNLWQITAREGVENLQIIKELDKERYPYQLLEDYRSFLDLDNKEDLFSAWKTMKNKSIYKDRLVKKVINEILTNTV